MGREGRTSFIRQVHFWGWGQNNIQQGTFIRSVSSFQPAWIESDPLSLLQEINQGHRDEPLRTWGKYDGNHTRVQDKLHQVFNFYYHTEYLLYSIASFTLFREFLECIPDVIFFQDCIEEEDITNVLNEVLRNGYKIHFQVRARVQPSFLIQNQASYSLKCLVRWLVHNVFTPSSQKHTREHVR